MNEIILEYFDRQIGYFKNEINYMQHILGMKSAESNEINESSLYNPAEKLCQIVGADKGAFFVFSGEGKEKVSEKEEKIVLLIDEDFSYYYNFSKNSEKINLTHWIKEDSITYGPEDKSKEACESSRTKRLSDMDEYIKEIFEVQNEFSYLWYPIFIKNSIKGGVVFLKSGRDRVFKYEDTQKISILPEFLFVMSQLTRANRLAAKSIEDNMQYKKGHSERVSDICGKIAKRMLEKQELVRIDGYNLRGLRDIDIAASLHDIGKTEIDSSIFQKPLHAGALLSEDEERKFKEHPEKGAYIVKGMGADIEAGIEHHHEAWDGSGYPKGLKGTDIPLISRIISIACTFDSELIKYIYKSEKPLEKAFESIENLKRKTLDPEIVNIFKEIFNQYSYDELEKDSYKLFDKSLGYIESGRKEEAVKWFEKAGEAEPKNLMLQMGIARKMTEMGMYDEAIKFYSKALEILPGFAEAYYERGKVYELHDNNYDAGIDYAIAVTLCPTYIEAHIKLGMVRMRLQKYKQAMDSFNKVIGLDLNNVLAYYGKGKCEAVIELEKDKDKVNLSYSIKILKKALYIYTSNFRAREIANKIYEDESLKNDIQTQIIGLE